MTALPGFTAEAVPLARIRGLHWPWDRIWRLRLVGGQGLLPKASLERGGPLSRHHALRDTDV